MDQFYHRCYYTYCMCPRFLPGLPQIQYVQQHSNSIPADPILDNSQDNGLQLQRLLNHPFLEEYMAGNHLVYINRILYIISL